MRTSSKLAFGTLICMGFLLGLLPMQQAIANRTPYFELHISVAAEDHTDYVLAQRIAPQLERLGIEVYVDQEPFGFFSRRLYPDGNNPYAIPSAWQPWLGSGYDLAVWQIGNGDPTLSTLHSSIRTRQTWFNDSVEYGVISPQLNDTQLDQALDAMLGLDSAIAAATALEQAFYRITWEFQPVLPLVEAVVPGKFHTRTLEGLSEDLAPSAPELRWAHNGLECWGFKPGVNRSELRIAIEARDIGFLPYASTAEIHKQPTEALLNSLLVPKGPGRDILLSEYVPDMAARLPFPVNGTNRVDGGNYTADDQRIWEVNLRPGITWQPGYGYPAMPLTVEDVFFTYQTLWNYSYWGWVLRSLLGPQPAEGLEVVNSTTFRLHLKTPLNETQLIRNFATLFTWPILPQHILNSTYVSAAGPGKTADGAFIHPFGEWSLSDSNLGYRTGGFVGPAVIGTGPYRWVGPNGTPSYAPNNAQITLSCNDDYFKDNNTLRLATDAPTWERAPSVSFLEFPDKEAGLAGLKNGTVDVLWDWAWWDWRDPTFHLPEEIINLWKSAQFNATVHGRVPLGLFVNTAQPRLTRPVRLAIAHAIDRDHLAQDVFETLESPVFKVVPNPLPLSRLHPAYPQNLPTPTYNLEKAWDYMEEAGYDMSPYRSEQMSAAKTSGLSLTAISLGIVLVILGRRRRRSRQPFLSSYPTEEQGVLRIADF